MLSAINVYGIPCLTNIDWGTEITEEGYLFHILHFSINFVHTFFYKQLNCFGQAFGCNKICNNL